MKFLGTHISTGHDNQTVCYATVKEAGAALPYDLAIDEYIDLLHAEIKNIDEGARLLHSLATSGESKLLADWKDDPADVSLARSIALPNGKLRSYASYNNTSAGKPLSADEVDMDIEADDHWYHDNPNY
jgi:hypothetical protein